MTGSRNHGSPQERSLATAQFCDARRVRSDIFQQTTIFDLSSHLIDLTSHLGNRRLECAGPSERLETRLRKIRSPVEVTPSPRLAVPAQSGPLVPEFSADDRQEPGREPNIAASGQLAFERRRHAAKRIGITLEPRQANVDKGGFRLHDSLEGACEVGRRIGESTLAEGDLAEQLVTHLARWLRGGETLETCG